MPKLDPYEAEILTAYEAGKLTSRAGNAERQRLRAAASATVVRDRRVNIRLSAADLLGLQAKALEEGVPYQALIASVLHKYVTGRLAECKPSVSAAKRRLPSRSN
ncbi:MAG: hypothetical protein NZ533_12240 [Casimicrobiaceae bacterium]|nr:hypothetical protein [Casimicrobiaceae bacterium]